MKPTTLIFSCEHAENSVPENYRKLFTQHQEVLATHRAIDFGAKKIGEYLAQAFDCAYIKSAVTRLLIDCNRSLRHPSCFSEFTKNLSKTEKQTLIETYYLPYRERVETLIEQYIAADQQVLHLSVHSFTPELNGEVRNAAIGLLYDSARHGEQEVAREWYNILCDQPQAYRIRKNYPYRGNSDGFTSALRKKYAQENYLGFEIEVNQALVQDPQKLDEVKNTLAQSIRELLLLL